MEPSYIREEIIRKISEGWILVEGDSQSIRQFRSYIENFHSTVPTFHMYHYLNNMPLSC